MGLPILDVDLPPAVRLELGSGDLPRLVVDTGSATGEVYLHGAHLTAWVPAGQAPVLWLSERSSFRADAAIRGGVPICFPWFGAGPEEDRTPAHGYARLRDWAVASIAEGGDGVAMTFELAARGDAEPLAATYRVTIGVGLALELEVRNEGDEAATFEEALHTYLAVSDVREVAVQGLTGASYRDRLGGPEPVVQEEEAIRFTAETDRIYQGSGATVMVEDPGGDRRIVVRKSGSASTIVWNPWVAKARSMADFGDDEWVGMLCVETANVRSDAITLQPGENHVMGAFIDVESVAAPA